MAIKKGGLGRGISALLPQSQSQYSTEQSQDTVHEVKVALIQPNRYQPRREFEPNALNELAESIKSYGILQPLIVRSIEDGRYELIAGERRLRASKIVGLENVPVIIRDYTDAQMSEISIIENVQRENLNVIEEAQAYDRLIKEFGHTQEVVAAKIGRSRSHISNILRLLKLSPTVRALIAKGLLTLGQARPLLAIENEVIQVQAAEMILSEGLSVRKVEAFINELKNSGLLASLTANLNSDITSTEIESSNITNGDIMESESENLIVKDETKVDTTPTNDKIIKADDPVKSEVRKNNKAVQKKNPDTSVYIREAENKLTDILGVHVKITSNKKCNRIQIDFAAEEDLSRIIESFEKLLPVSSNKTNLTATTKEEKIAALRKFSTSQNFNI